MSVCVADMKRQIYSLPIHELNNSALGVVDRCLLMSAFLGLIEDIKFWTVVLYYLQATTLHKERYFHFNVSRSNPFAFGSWLTHPSISSENDVEELDDNKFANKYFALQPLDTSYDFLCDRYTFQVMNWLVAVRCLLLSLFSSILIDSFVGVFTENATWASRTSRMEARWLWAYATRHRKIDIARGDGPSSPAAVGNRFQ